MRFEIIRWSSISLCWIAMVLNIIGLIRNIRSARRFNKLSDEYFNKYLELLEKEFKNEL